ncbi:OmpA family protein [Neisseria gonorrhoeae]
METIKNTLFVASAMILTACAAPKQEVAGLPQDATYTVEQNQLGEFVFCRNEECSGFERKVLAEQPVYAQTQTNLQKDEIRVFFNLGSLHLGAEGVRTLKRVLPKLKNTQTVYLRGWADSIGGRNTAINRRLAKQRAAVIGKWLRKHNVSAKIRTASSPACCNSDDTRTVVITW